MHRNFVRLVPVPIYIQYHRTEPYFLLVTTGTVPIYIRYRSYHTGYFFQLLNFFLEVQPFGEDGAQVLQFLRGLWPEGNPPKVSYLGTNDLDPGVSGLNCQA